MTSSILFPFAPFALLSTVFASPVFDSIDILEINSFSSRLGMCPQKIPIRRRQVVFTHSISPTMNGGITKPVIMDVVQYEGVNSPDCTSWQRGNREVCTAEWSHRLSCWSWWTTRAPIEPKICLLRFFSSVNCPPAANSIIQNSLWQSVKTLSTPYWISAAALSSGKQAQALRFWTWPEYWWLTPIVNGRLVLRFTESWIRWVFSCPEQLNRTHCPLVPLSVWPN